MSGLNTKYIPMANHQIYFVDPETGAPLSAGTLTAYEDDDRATLMPLFKLKGTPPNYEYEELPNNPLILSTSGTTVDADGNDIIPYFYPYDETGDLKLYYYVVKNSDGDTISVREGQPNLSVGGSETSATLTNYQYNGQFLIHNDVRGDVNYPGKITTDITSLDTGNWTFERTAGSDSTDYIEFTEFEGFIEIPPGSPKYACRVICENPGTVGGYKSLRYRIPDVNKFSSLINYFTGSFYGRTNTGEGLTIDVNIVKNYGIGGSATETIKLGSVVLKSSYDHFDLPFVFGTNEGKTIGSGSYSQLEISLPHYAFDASFTNFALTQGINVLNFYPLSPEPQVRYESNSLLVPDYSGNNFGLPLILTSGGVRYDLGHVGRRYTFTIPFNEANNIGMLHADGRTLDPLGYSSHGIPYKRLRDAYALVDDGSHYWGQPRYGTGLEYCTAEGDIANPTWVYVTVNYTNIGEVLFTLANDGSIATTFTFSSEPRIVNFTTTKIICKPASDVAAGSFLEFYNHAGKKFIVWYKKDGLGTKPTTVAEKHIEVDLEGNDADHDVARKTYIAINYAYFALPYYFGAFSRGASYDSNRDPDAGTRTSSTLWGQMGCVGNNVGTEQGDELRSHTHTVYGYSPWGHRKNGDDGTEVIEGGGLGVTYTGGNETRPRNINVDYAIGY